jgi:cellulose synthase (UDP-forming)
MSNLIFGKEPIIRAAEPSKIEKRNIRVLIFFGISFMIIFIWWFFDNTEASYPLLYYPLTFVLMFKLLRMIHEWYHYYNPGISPMPELKTKWNVDMFTTFCAGEPYDMIIRTLKGMKAVKYPHTTYLCDEADDPYLKKVCEELDIVHITRKEKVNAKAGNINNALKLAKGEIVVVLDPDHNPHPYFLHRTLPCLEDPEVGYVQVVQAYGNQNESFIARGAAEQTYTFYGPMMMCMNSYGTVQAIGANCTFRRKALDSIGGHAAGLSEDMHTAMRIHAKGWKSVYVPEILSRGYVPATLPGYYKQQLKWSRGTFDLLFKVVPKLFKDFSWRQKIHYLTLPLYFLYGLITMVDIFIPIFSLFLSQSPWEITLYGFASLYLPLCFVNIIIRVYAQRWLLEKSERGLHLAGGILRIGTWWIHLTGFVYTLFNVKVPYIPTPKNDKPQNNWLLSIPNILVIFLCIIAIVYGLNRDWNPYTFLMAGFALMNAMILSVVVLMGQEKFILKCRNHLRENNIVKVAFKPVQKVKAFAGQMLFMLFSRGAVSMAVIMAVFLLSFTGREFILSDSDYSEIPEKKNTGGFYTGIFIPELNHEHEFSKVSSIQSAINSKFDIVSFYQAWGWESISKFPHKMISDIYSQNSIPMITWEPWSCTFPEYEEHPELSSDKKILKYINQGYFDHYLENYSTLIRDLKKPVMLRFAHEMDNPAYPWSHSGENTPEDFINAWIYVIDFFEKKGASNVTWVWNPWSPEGLTKYYPGENFVDWIALTCLNYGQASPNGKWLEFESVYRRFGDIINNHPELRNKPVMLAEFGSTAYGGNQELWLKDALEKMNKFPEIKSAVFFYSDQDKNWITDWRPDKKTEYIDWTFKDSNAFSNLLSDNLNTSRKRVKINTAYKAKVNVNMPEATAIKRTKTGNYYLEVNGEEFFIKGIAYNPCHDWRDGNIPLSRKKLMKDFKLIQEMGANTIRRYNPGLYDRNILNIAEETGLKVIYGFYFAPDVDYFSDTIKVNKYIDETLEYVEKYKDYPSVLAWGIGNETWGLLKHHFQKPYLTQVRNSYVEMLERIALEIKKRDSGKAVITCSEHSWQLAGELVAMQEAPSIDIIGINSYYNEQISTLLDLNIKYNPGRPYLISEFGPRGYWNRDYTAFENDCFKEDNDFQKAKWYEYQWKNYIAKNKGFNIGGVAYSWSDRQEGSITLYGVTDMKDRKKQSYYSLKTIWTNKKYKTVLFDLEITGPYNNLQPNKEYTFSFKGKFTSKPNLKYEWVLVKEKNFKKTPQYLNVDEASSKVKITLPDKNEKYRLHLFVSDKKGNVISASKPVFVSVN